MRVLLSGFILFVIWSFFSAWLYVDILKPVMSEPEPVAVMPDPQAARADSLAKIYALMPAPLTFGFDFDKAKFSPGQEVETRLSEFKSWLDKYPGSILLVEGHTDLVGTPEYNNELGLKRALAVSGYLETKGFPASRMEILSGGEEDPVAGYITDEERALNRRTEISIKK